MSPSLERVIKRFKRDRLALASAIFLLVLILVALLAPYLGLPDPTEMNIGHEVELPSRSYWLGTDSFGRDNLSQIIYGARVSIKVALGSVALAACIGTLIGLIAGYYGRSIDRILMRVMDAVLAFPPILLAVALLGVLGSGERNVILGLGIVYVPVFARIVRSKTLAEVSRDYVMAAQAMGANDAWIIYRHILPNVVSPIIVQASVSAAFSIVAEAGMSFLGLGTQPPTPSWGIMLSSAREYIYDQPWFSLIPGVVLVLTVLSITFVGDSLREALDSKA